MPPGRPKLPPGEAKRHTAFRLSPNTLADLAAIAAARGTSTTAVLEALIEKEIDTMPNPTFTVRRPNGGPDREAPVVSKHQTIEAARRALARQQKGAKAQGGCSQDIIWDEAADEAAPLDD